MALMEGGPHGLSHTCNWVQ